MNVRPAVILVTGTPGSGKTSVTTAVAEALSLPRLNMDEFVHRAIDPSVPGLTFNQRFLLAEQSAIYAAEAELRAGRSIVLDASLFDASDWTYLIAITEAADRRLLAYRPEVVRRAVPTCEPAQCRWNGSCVGAR